jgi:hypothetical protein
MENENNFDNNQIDVKNISSSVINEKEIKKFNSVNINTNYFENSKNYISKELFFSNKNKSQSENSNDDTSSLSQRNSYNQQNNLLLS